MNNLQTTSTHRKELAHRPCSRCAASVIACRSSAGVVTVEDCEPGTGDVAITLDLLDGGARADAQRGTRYRLHAPRCQAKGLPSFSLVPGGGKHRPTSPASRAAAARIAAGKAGGR